MQTDEAVFEDSEGFSPAISDSDDKYFSDIIIECSNKIRELNKSIESTKRWQRFISTTTAVLGTLAGGTGIGTIVNYSENETATQIVLGAISLFAVTGSVLTTVQTSLNFQNQIKESKKLKTSYAEVIRDVREYARAPDVKNLANFKRDIWLKVQDLNSTA